MAEATSNGIDRRTGMPLAGWPQVMQSIEVILTTAYFERMMRPYVGSLGLRLFGELANRRTAQRFRWTVATALLLFEPRFHPLRIDQLDLDRTGDTTWMIEGDYRPRGHLGDLTSAGRRTLSLVAGESGLSLTGTN
jgi:phage baseplate assembly protein W